MSRQNILNKGSVMEKLTKLLSLPTLQNVIQGYYWRQNELKAGKGPNYNPTISEVASLLESDIRQTWMLLIWKTLRCHHEELVKKFKPVYSFFPT